MQRDFYSVLGEARTARRSRTPRPFHDPGSRPPAWTAPAEADGPADPLPWLGAPVAAPPAPGDADDPHVFDDFDAAYGALSDARPEAHPSPGRVAPLVAAISLLRDFEAIGPSRPEVFDRFVRSFTGRHAAKSQSVQRLGLALVVSAQQAAAGGVITIGVPAFAPCPACGGSGRDWQYLCTGWRGHGVVAVEEPMHVQLPAQLRDGDVLDVALFQLGVADQSLRLCFRIAS